MDPNNRYSISPGDREPELGPTQEGMTMPGVHLTHTEQSAAPLYVEEEHQEGPESDLTQISKAEFDKTFPRYRLYGNMAVSLVTLGRNSQSDRHQKYLNQLNTLYYREEVSRPIVDRVVRPLSFREGRIQQQRGKEHRRSVFTRDGALALATLALVAHATLDVDIETTVKWSNPNTPSIGAPFTGGENSVDSVDQE